MNILLAQTVNELNYIFSKTSFLDDTTVLPINLELQSYCLAKNIKHINVIEFIDNDLHKKIIKNCELALKKLDYGELDTNSQKKVYKNYIRKRFYSINFIDEIFKKITKKNKIKKIFISGWKSLISENSFDKYIISEIIESLFEKNKIISLEKQEQENKTYKTYKLKIQHIQNSNKKSILFTGFGYNLGRVIIEAIKKNFRVLVFDQEDLNFLKRIIFFLLGIKLIKFIKTKNEYKNKIKLKDINLNFKNRKYLKFLNLSKETFLEDLTLLKTRCLAIDDFLLKLKPSLVVSVIARDFQGYCGERANFLKIPSICISHGTVSQAFNKYDLIYKKNICEAVFDGDFTYFSIQSKIAEQSLKTHKVGGKKIFTGNIVFAENKKKCTLFKKKILYAVTTKDFVGLQFYGVELYCEFFENVKLISKITKKNNLEFIIHLHPSINDISKKNLKTLFPNLEFVSGNISKSLKKSFVTISFSSTVIEDSLFSKVPVILFDRWNRYKHCTASLDPKIKNEPIYYINNEKKLLEAIKTVKISNNIKFDKIIFKNSSKKNIGNMLENII